LLHNQKTKLKYFNNDFFNSPGIKGKDKTKTKKEKSLY